MFNEYAFSQAPMLRLALLLAGQRLQVQAAQPLGPAELPVPSVPCWSRAGELCAGRGMAELGNLMSEAWLESFSIAVG